MVTLEAFLRGAHGREPNRPIVLEVQVKEREGTVRRFIHDLQFLDGVPVPKTYLANDGDAPADAVRCLVTDDGLVVPLVGR